MPASLPLPSSMGQAAERGCLKIPDAGVADPVDSVGRSVGAVWWLMQPANNRVKFPGGERGKLT